MKSFLLIFFFLLTLPLKGIESGLLHQILKSHPFSYDLSPLICEGVTTNEEVMLCCHGMGGSEQVAHKLQAYKLIPFHLVGFRFPDYGPNVFNCLPEKTHFGTIDELLPLLFLLKKLVIDADLTKIHLYGFSAGGGALVNTLGVLNQSHYRDALKKIGITEKVRTKILSAIEKGWVILECPLKSLDELIDFWGHFPPLECVAARYARNHLRPIDSLNRLAGLKLNVLLYFQNPDEVIFNRDDHLYIQRLSQSNSLGTTKILIHNEGGHSTFHAELWKTFSFLYANKLQN